MVEHPKRFTNAFNYCYEKRLEAGETVIVAMPPVSANARGINDIAYLCPESVTVQGTISRDFTSPEAMWQEILNNEEVNKTITAMRFTAGEEPATVMMRIILY